MNATLRTPALFVLILNLLLSSCGQLSTLGGAPTQRGADPLASGTESSIPEAARNAIISTENAKNLAQISSWGKGSGHHPTYSPDGTRMAVSSSSGIYLYDPQTLQESLRIEAPYDVRAIAFTPDGKALSSIAGTFGEITVQQWDLTSGSELLSWGADETYNNDASIVALSADGGTLAVLAGTYDDGTVRLLDVSGGQELHSLSVFYAYDVALSADGKTLGVVNHEGITLWDVSGGGQLRTIVTSPDLVNPAIISLTFSPDGKTLATGSEPAPAGNTERGTLQVFDVASGMPVSGFSDDAADCLALSPDGQTLASGSSDVVQVWDAASGDEIFSIHSGNVESLSFSPDGKTLVSASSVGDDSVHLWDAETGDLLDTLKGDDVGGEAIWSADSRTIAYESATGFTVGLRDVASGEVRSLSGHPYYVESVAFSPDGTMLASSSMWNAMLPPSNLLKLWDAASGQEIGTFEGHRTSVGAVAFSPDGKTLASVDWDGTIKLWDIASGTELRTLSGNTGIGYGVAFSPDGKLLASAFNETGDVVKLWDIASGTEVSTLSVNTDAGLNVAFSPDGKVLVSSDHFGFGLRQVWDVATGHELAGPSQNTDTRRSFAFSPDGRTLAVGSEDGTVKLWDLASGDQLYTLSGHSGNVRSVVFSVDGKLIFSSGGDQIKVWEAAGGRELASLSLSKVLSIVASPDGKLLLAHSSSGMSLWGVSP